jgi:tryptophan synthase alpha subunit
MSRQGLTGAVQGFDPELKKYLDRVRRCIKSSIALGFGISSRERLRAVIPYADIAVVGSAVIDIIAASKPNAIRRNIQQFLTTLTEEIGSVTDRV